MRSDAETLLERAAAGEPVVLGVGEVLPFSPARRRAASLPVDVARTIEETLTAVALDVVHVHEPFAPSASSVALRHSRALNVGSFHEPTERVLSTQLTAPLSRLLFSRLDARTASYRATRELLQRYFPADYRVIMPGADQLPAHSRPKDGPVELVMIATEERAALRVFLRALRALRDDCLQWHATVWSGAPARGAGDARARAARARQVRRRIAGGGTGQLEALAGADIVVLASEGLRTTAVDARARDRGRRRAGRLAAARVRGAARRGRARARVRAAATCRRSRRTSRG